MSRDMRNLESFRLKRQSDHRNHGFAFQELERVPRQGPGWSSSWLRRAKVCMLTVTGPRSQHCCGRPTHLLRGVTGDVAAS